MEPEPTARKRRGYFLPGVIALVALVVIGVVLGAGDLAHPASTSIQGPDIAQQIAEGIQAQQASGGPPSVACPASEPVRDGLTFQCTLRRDGRVQPVYVVEIDGRGEIRWSLSAP